MEKSQALKLPGMFSFRYYSAGLMGSETHIHSEQPVQRSPSLKGRKSYCPLICPDVVKLDSEKVLVPLAGLEAESCSLIPPQKWFRETAFNNQQGLKYLQGSTSIIS